MVATARRRSAAAVETSASIGGLIDPDDGGRRVLMAEFLGVPYWDVVLRGFGFSFIYYISIGVAIYLLSVRLPPAADRQAAGAALREGDDRHLFRLGALSHLSAGNCRQGELRAAAYRELMLAVLVAVFLTSSTCARILPRGETLFASLRRGSNACRDGLLPDAAARHARHHDRLVHGHRLHQSDGGDAARRRRLEHLGHDPDGLCSAGCSAPACRRPPPTSSAR
jgi:hypothetical protein